MFLAVLAPGQRAGWVDETESLRGAALGAAGLYAWGAALYEWNTATWTRAVLARSARGFGEGGCVNAAGSVLLQDGVDGGPLVLISRQGRRTVWDRRVEMHDCAFATLFGRSGALIVNHYGQVRFYEGPDRYREIYSFYTASRQAGLLVRDIDGDGLPDIFAGNYWIRSPRQFELPWRLFAINVRHETADSATMALAWHAGDLYASQGHLRDGSVFQYRAGAALTELWEERELASGLRFPHALAAGAFGLLVAENDGPGSGVFLGSGGGRLERIGTTGGAHSAFVIADRVALVGAHSVDWWDVQRRR